MSPREIVFALLFVAAKSAIN